jgi:hypothetical protein
LLAEIQKQANLNQKGKDSNGQCGGKRQACQQSILIDKASIDIDIEDLANIDIDIDIDNY